MQMFPHPDLISALHQDRHDRLTAGRPQEGASPPRRGGRAAGAGGRARRRHDA
jgi:hypothetical protein